MQIAELIQCHVLSCPFQKAARDNLMPGGEALEGALAGVRMASLILQSRF
ncbi:MAG TPA: hypothetical protein VF463_15300 [Sphingobium sp.]